MNTEGKYMPGASRPRLLFVGAFPSEGRRVFGGNVTDCRTLMGSSFKERFDLDLIDSTQITNPPPSFAVRSALAARRFIKYIRRFEANRPDAVLLFCAVGASLVEKAAMAWYARLRGTPALLFPRGGALIDMCRRSRFTAWWVRCALRGGRKLLCQGPAWKSFAEEVCGFHPQDAFVITNWTASTELLGIGTSRKPRPAGTPLRLVFVGWVERSKGVFELVEATRILMERNRAAFTLDMAGDGHALQEIRDLVGSLGLGDRIRLHGWSDPAKVATLYAANDVFVLPSYAEGLPNAMIEAMAAGLAVVVTPVGAVPDVVSDGRQGLLVPPKDPEALANALERLMDRPDLLAGLARTAHDQAREEFGVETAVRRFLEVVQSTQPQELPTKHETDSARHGSRRDLDHRSTLTRGNSW